MEKIITVNNLVKKFGNFTANDNLSFDAGFTLVQSEDSSFKETNASGQELTFDSDGMAYISSVQMNYTFN